MEMERRKMLKMSGLAMAAWAAGGAVFAEEKKKGQEEVSPPEDLMREHGVLRRILLIYRNDIFRLERGKEIAWDSLADSANIIRSFIEEYHEKLEENYIFPAMRKAGKLTDLVDFLEKQHRAGRQITALVLKIAGAKKNPDQDTLRKNLAAFIRMYEPHAAREDTVLFPALRSAVGEKDFKRMGDVFEKEEDRLFGEHGFEKMVDRVAAIEKKLGLYELDQFTPKLPL